MGWFMVESGLAEKPDVSHFRLSAHLTIAFLIYSMLFYSFWNYFNKSSAFDRHVRSFQLKSHNIRITLSIFFLIITVSSGAFVSGTNAGWAYNNFPLMGNNFFPPIIYEENFPSIVVLFNDIGFIQFFHRILATLTMILIIYTVYKAIKDFNFINLRGYFYILGFFIIFQYSLGILILKYFVPKVLGLSHQIGSLLVLTMLIIIYSEIKKRGARARPSL